MKWIPHDYQRTAVKFLLEHSCAALFLDPGLGKSSIIYSTFKILQRQGLVKDALIIAPLRVANSVWPREANKWDEFNEFRLQLLHGNNKRSDIHAEHNISIINPEGLEWLFDQSYKWDMLVVDECFPAETLISTIFGYKKIKFVKSGDFILTTKGPQQVIKNNKRKVNKLIKIKLSNGNSLKCTPEHPIFTDVGWVPAYLTKGRLLYDKPNMSNMSKKFLEFLCNDKTGKQSKMLFEILRSETNVARKTRIKNKNVRSNEKGKARKIFLEQGTKLESRTQRKNVSNSFIKWSNIYCSRWKRERFEQSGGALSKNFAERVYMELRNKIGRQAAWLSYLLQSRFWVSKRKNSNRNRWSKSQTNFKTKSRQKERVKIRRTRVVSISHIKRRSYVYNIMVRNCPHFFANRILVHNSTKFKHTDTKRFKELKRHLHRFKRRYILTGSPIPNGLIDLFGQIYILDFGKALGDGFITRYRAKYFDYNPYNFEYKLKPHADEQIYKLIEPMVIRLDEKDCLPLEPYIQNEIEIDLNGQSRLVYNQMEKLLITEVNDETIMAANAGVATSKCRQIANGGIYDLQGNAQHIHHSKTEAVVDLIEELNGKPCLIAYEFKHDLQRLLAWFPGTPHLGAGVTSRQQQDIEDKWNAGELPMLLVNPQSASFGLNLQGVGAAIIFYGIPWNLEYIEQLIRRVWRQGQTQRIVVHFIIARDTIDEVIMKVIKSKSREQKALLDALRNYTNDK